MFEMPAPTMALYALTFMSLTVLVARLWVGGVGTLASWSPAIPSGWWFIAGLTAVTGLSRLTLFSGVRNLGSLQTILLNMAEIAVTLVVAALWLDERMTAIQWVGVAILAGSVLLSRWDTEVRDHSYRPLLRPTPLGGLTFNLSEPIAPSDFGTVTRLYRRQPRTFDLSDFDIADE
jgi:drug/metabolite transporter (DMT)-like permease